MNESWDQKVHYCVDICDEISAALSTDMINVTYRSLEFIDSIDQKLTEIKYIIQQFVKENTE